MYSVIAIFRFAFWQTATIVDPITWLHFETPKRKVILYHWNIQTDETLLEGLNLE